MLSVPLSLETDFKDISTVYLLLGPACNMQCRHCHQMPFKQQLFDLTLSSNVMDFLSTFIRFALSKKFQFTEKTFFLSFWGGEPLLHWDFVKDIIFSLTHRLNLLHQSVFSFVLTTNGLLLTPEIVSFLNDYHVRLNFSYDAPYPFAVRGYVPDTVCRLVNQVDDLTVISAGSAYNCDPMLARRCLEAKFPHAKKYICRFEVMRTFADMAADIDAYDFEKIRVSLRKIVIASKMGGSWAKAFIHRLMSPVLYPDSDFAYFHRTGGCGSCISGYKNLAVTPHGILLFCFNSSDVIGSLSEDSLDTVYSKCKHLWHSVYDPACASCDVQKYCSWGCTQLLRDKSNHALTCERFRKPFFRIFDEELKSLNTTLTSFEIAWFQSQSKLMQRQIFDFLDEPLRFELEHTCLPMSFSK